MLYSVFQATKHFGKRLAGSLDLALHSYRIIPGSSGGAPVALSLAIQRYPTREVLPGNHVVVRTAAVEPSLQAGTQVNGEGESLMGDTLHCTLSVLCTICGTAALKLICVELCSVSRFYRPARNTNLPMIAHRF